MKYLYLLLASLFVISCAPFSNSPKQLREATKSVVLVRVDSPMGSWAGSAFVVQSDKNSSVLLTNKHVCIAQDAADYTITDYNGNKVQGHWIKNAAETDLCELTMPEKLPAVKLAKYDAKPNDKVVIIGFPYALGPLTNVGYAGRYTPIDIVDGPLAIHTMAQNVSLMANPGNSGSPVFNESGEVVSILFCGDQRSAFISYVIPVSTIHFFLLPGNDFMQSTF